MLNHRCDQVFLHNSDWKQGTSDSTSPGRGREEGQNQKPTGEVPMSLILKYLRFALAGVIVVTATDSLPAAQGNRQVTVSVARGDLRPLPGVILQLTGAVNQQAVT